MKVAINHRRWAVWFLRAIPKSAHQILALAIYRPVRRFGLKMDFSNWPEGSPFRNSTDYRGLRIAEINVSLEKIRVVNDHVDQAGNLIRAQRFIPLESSRRLELWQHHLNAAHRDEDYWEALTPFDRREMKSLESLATLKSSTVAVILNLNGDITVLDGFHRLIALSVRDGNIKNLKFFVTI